VDGAVGFFDRKDIAGEHRRRAYDRRAGTIQPETGHASYGQNEVGRQEDEGGGQARLLSEEDLGNHKIGHLLVPALGNAVEGEAEILGLAGPEVTCLPAGDGDALA
jgi:hypothetical protein